MTRISDNLASRANLTFANRANAANGAGTQDTGSTSTAERIANDKAAFGASAREALNAERPAAANESESTSGGIDPVEQIKKTIERLKEQLREARQQLEEAQRRAEAAPDDDAAQAALQAAQQQVATLSAALQQAYASLMEALEKSGGDKAGQTVNTRA